MKPTCPPVPSSRGGKKAFFGSSSRSDAETLLGVEKRNFRFRFLFTMVTCRVALVTRTSQVIRFTFSHKIGKKKRIEKSVEV